MNYSTIVLLKILIIKMHVLRMYTVIIDVKIILNCINGPPHNTAHNCFESGVVHSHDKIFVSKEISMT